MQGVDIAQAEGKAALVQHVVLGQRRSFRAQPGPHRLETADDTVVALVV